MRLRFEVVFPHVVLLLNLVVDLWYLGHENQRSSQGRSISCSATYAKLPSFYASILSFYGNPNTCQWWKQFYGNILLSWICFSGHFGFSSGKDDRLIAIFWITSVRVIQNFQKSPSSRGRADVPGYTLKWAYYHVPTRRKGFAGWLDESWLTATNLTVLFSCRGVKYVLRSRLELNIHLVDWQPTP